MKFRSFPGTGPIAYSSSRETSNSGDGGGEGSEFALFICVDSSRPVKEISVMSGRVFLG